LKLSVVPEPAATSCTASWFSAVTVMIPPGATAGAEEFTVPPSMQPASVAEVGMKPLAL